MFFTYFKGEFKASLLYEKLLPFILVWESGEFVYEDPSDIPDAEGLIAAEKMVSLQKLTKFIDSFNFYPVKVDQIHFKNTSYEMTHVMTGNQRGNLAEKPKTVGWQEKSDDEQRLLKLLSLVSFKIHERFRNMREAFRYIDTDHSQSISVNEFAQAVDFFRLKISFEDVMKLFRFMDTDGDGEIGFDEFTLLAEERWKAIDPYAQYQKGVEGRE